jgi:hypothetical protein
VTTLRSADARHFRVRGSRAPRTKRQRRRRSIVVIFLVLAVVAETKLYVIPTSNQPRQADAVIVLGGHEYQTRIYDGNKIAGRFGGAVLVVSTPAGQVCEPKPPGALAIICFRPDPSTTQGEAREAAKLAKQYGWKSLTVVTTGDQIWRARLRFSRCWSGTLLMVRAPSSLLLRLKAVPYETAATVKAEVLQRSC